MFEQQPAPNRPAGYDPKTGRIYEEPWYDPTASNPIQGILKQLMGQAGPRGATFRGRVNPQGQAPDLKTLLTQMPIDVPEESYGALPGMDLNFVRNMQG